MRKPFALIVVMLLAVLLSSCVSSKPIDLSPRQETVENVVSFIETNHPDPYRAAGRKAFRAAEQKLLDSCDEMEEIDFYLSLQALVSMVGDSHTALNFFQLVDAVFLVQVYDFDGTPILVLSPSDGERFIGWEVKRIGGVSYGEFLGKLGKLMSWDNEVFLASNASGFMQMAPVMRYLGLSDGQTLRLELASGSETATYDVKVAASGQIPQLASIAALMKGTAPTSNQGVPYWLTGLDDRGSLYFQYNVCEENPEARISEVVQALQEAAPSVLVIDLRSNGGGDSQVLQPVIDYVAEHPGTRTCVLIGRSTFSSAILNAEALKLAGATLYGEPTGGSANHFGELVNLRVAEGVRLFCSTKTFGDKNEMGHPLMPDVLVRISLQSFLEGSDDVVKAALGSY